MSKEELVTNLLENGWEWKASSSKGYFVLSKGDFKWELRHSYTIHDLIHMLVTRGDK